MLLQRILGRKKRFRRELILFPGTSVIDPPLRHVSEYKGHIFVLICIWCAGLEVPHAWLLRVRGQRSDRITAELLHRLAELLELARLSLDKFLPTLFKQRQPRFEALLRRVHLVQVAQGQLVHGVLRVQGTQVAVNTMSCIRWWRSTLASRTCRSSDAGSGAAS